MSTFDKNASELALEKHLEDFLVKNWRQTDLRLRRALGVCTNIDFYRYQIDFKLIKGV